MNISKYIQIIQEECNVKNVVFSEATVTPVIKPKGFALKEKYGSKTGQIIAAAKQSGVMEGDSAVVIVNDERIVLLPHEFDIVYEGLDENTMAAEGDIIVKVDTTLTEELKREGTVRELSRFINQLRKDAQFQVADRIDLYIVGHDYISSALKEHEGFIQSQALVQTIHYEAPSHFDKDGDFEDDGYTARIWLKNLTN